MGPAHIELERSVLLSGRYINDRDVIESRKVAVVGPNIVQDLFGKSDPLGAFIRINAVLFQVVGTFEDLGHAGKIGWPTSRSPAQQLYRTEEGWTKSCTARETWKRKPPWPKAGACFLG